MRELEARIATEIMGIEGFAPRICMHTGAYHHVDKSVILSTPRYLTNSDSWNTLLDRLAEMDWNTNQYSAVRYYTISFFAGDGKTHIHKKAKTRIEARAKVITELLDYLKGAKT